ncbi:Short-chain dehydrogenase/reductase phmF [Exophiala dermatitidis]
MSMLGGLKRLLDQKRNPPKPATESFAGRTILLTGASGGLGLEAAKKLVGLNVSRLIITARSEEKGQAAKKQIEAYLRAARGTAASNSTEIVPLVLNMSSFDSIQTFVETLKSRVQKLDGAILNAGTLQASYVQSADGWEEMLQVNALSTFLLGLLLLPLLTASAEDNDGNSPTNYKPHLTFVSSGTAWTVSPAKMTVFMGSETPLEDLSSQKHFPPGTFGGQTQYARTKLVLEYAVRHLAALPSLKGPDGQPRVIVNTTCPGMCKSDLGRQMMTNLIVKLLSWILFTVFARTADQGANTFVTALTQGVETHGEMWKDDRVYEPGPMCATEEGRKFGDRVWSELLQVMVKADTRIKLFLS